MNPSDNPEVLVNKSDCPKADNGTDSSKTSEAVKTSSPDKTSPSKKDCDTVTEALNHLVQGKRHLLVKDIKSAVNSFQEACKLLSENFGELGSECAEAYFYYGKSLLELARLESGVLGPGFDKDESEQSEEDEDEDEQEQSEQPDQIDKGEADDDKVTDATSQDGEGEGSACEDNDENDEDLTGEVNKVDDKDNEGEEDEVTSLQLSWEVLEMAKIIFEKQCHTSKDCAMKLAQTYLKLGEVSMESENHDQAVEDILQCVKLQEQYLHSHDRLLAETYFQLGSAYCLQNDFPKSLEVLDKVIQTIRDRMKCLQDRANNLKKGSKQEIMGCIHDDEVKQIDPFYTLESEIQELDQIIPGIESKIADVLEVKRQAEQNVMKELHDSIMGLGSSPVKQVDDTSSTSLPSSSQSNDSQKPVSNISHLVKKRKGDSATENVSKRLCMDGPGANNH